MSPRKLGWALQGACVIASLAAAAGEIHWPRPGRPAVVVPGGSFEIGASAEGPMRLEGAGGAVDLAIEWRDSSAAPRGLCTLPASLAPGRYDLSMTADGAGSVRRGAVHVVGEMPAAYALAVFRADPAAADAGSLPADLAATLNAASVQLAIIVGPLPAPNAVAAHEALEALLLAADMPVFFCPDTADLQWTEPGGQSYTAIHSLTYGLDGYLFLGAGLAAIDPNAHERLGAAHQLRRAMRASRWSIGVAGRYELGWDLRAQVALFVDDPLNYLIAGAVPAGFGGRVPWGTATYVPAPETPRGELLIVDVSDAGVKPRTASEPTPEPAAE